mgnify:CR=1 FL=1
MKKYILASILLGLVLSCDAQAKKTKDIPIIDKLTNEEQICRFGGIILQAIAVDRDALVPLTTTIAHLRIMLGTSSPAYQQTMIELAQLLYKTPNMPGTVARYAFELGCVTSQETRPTDWK